MKTEESAAAARCSLFAGMMPADREALLSCLGAFERRYARGEALWLTGDTVTACAVILSGSVRAESMSASGERTLTAVHTAGSLVGDVLMATRGGKSPVDIVAAQETAALFLPYGAVMTSCGKCCARHDRLRENLLAEIAAKYWALRRRAMYLSKKNLSARLAAFLLDCARDAGSDTFSVGMRREDMADLLGANRSALCRSLSRLRNDGKIECYRDSFRIQDREALSALAAGGGS